MKPTANRTTTLVYAGKCKDMEVSTLRLENLDLDTDIRYLAPNARQILMLGPPVHVKVCGTPIGTIRHLSLLAVSQEARDFQRTHGGISHIHIRCVPSAAVDHILNWLDVIPFEAYTLMTPEIRKALYTETLPQPDNFTYIDPNDPIQKAAFPEIPLTGDLEHDIIVHRAARALGLASRYTEHIVKSATQTIRSRWITTGMADMIMKWQPEGDSENLIFDALVSWFTESWTEPWFYKTFHNVGYSIRRPRLRNAVNSERKRRNRMKTKTSAKIPVGAPVPPSVPPVESATPSSPRTSPAPSANTSVGVTESNETSVLVKRKSVSDGSAVPDKKLRSQQ
jgi:hypothetical protein